MSHLIILNKFQELQALLIKNYHKEVYMRISHRELSTTQHLPITYQQPFPNNKVNT